MVWLPWTTMFICQKIQAFDNRKDIFNNHQQKNKSCPCKYPSAACWWPSTVKCWDIREALLQTWINFNPRQFPSMDKYHIPCRVWDEITWPFPNFNDAHWSLTRPPLERRKTLGHLSSINPNMINHYASQSQTCQLLKNLKNIFFFSNKENVKSGAINFRLNWYTKSISIMERSYIYIYIYIHIYVEFLASHFNDLSKFTVWAIIEELSIRRRPRTFLVSWGQKIRVKYCYVDLSSWYGFWFAIICIDLNVVLDFSIAIQQFRDGFGCQ